MLTRSNLAGCGAKDLMCFHTLRVFVTNIFGGHALRRTEAIEGVFIPQCLASGAILQMPAAPVALAARAFLRAP